MAMLKENGFFGPDNRYKLLRLLGRGGFSEVWLAQDQLTTVEMAIKVYAPGAGLDENGLKIFRDEFALVFDLNHTNLLKPTFFDTWERMPYLIMTLCKRGSAFSHIADHRPITEQECWAMIHDVAAGLAYLHQRSVVHQDIKPDNILISDEGTYMITDFGISARVRSTIRKGGAPLEQSGGTLAYMAPERFSESPQPCSQSDVWSVGAMMYELMTLGTPPFGNHGGLLQQNGAKIPLIQENYSETLKQVIYACLASDKEQRPTAAELEDYAYRRQHGLQTGPLHVIPATPDVHGLQQENAQKNGAPQKSAKKGTAQDKQKQKEPRKDIGAITKKKNSKWGWMAAATALIVLIGLVAMCGGEEEQTTTPPVEVPVVRLNIDSLNQLVRMSKARGDKSYQDGCAYMVDHEWDYLDTELEADHVEHYFIDAIMYYAQALAVQPADSVEQSLRIAAQQGIDSSRERLIGLVDELKEISQQRTNTIDSILNHY